MEFRILGPIEVEDDEGSQLQLGGPKPRTLLAALLVRAGTVVPDSQLIEWMWGDRPPSTATAQIQAYASELRRLLGDAVTITRRRPGYLLRINRGRLDLATFGQLVERASGAVSGAAQTAADLRAALALWRGHALGGVTDYLIDAEQPRLEERRLAALEDRIEADLVLGRHADLIAELTGLVAEHPLRERLRGQLMLALYRCGRQGNALSVYAEGRRVLAAELGIDPGSQLRRLETGILAADPALAAPETEPPPAVRPAQLPPDVPDFTGRDKSLQQMITFLTPTDGEPAEAVVIAAIAGMAGVGKTSLAVHIAHRLRENFPDGQLYADLRGADREPLDAREALARLLRALGVLRIPDGLAERAELYRSRLADRRMIILLDNAAGEYQVRALLPGTPRCAVIVTSRGHLAGLEGARLVDLDVFEPEQAVELLGHIVGPERIAAEPDAAERVVQLCGYLPLAVRIAGGRLAARPHWRLARLADRLTDERRRLDELRLGDLEVRAGLTLSYQSLDPLAARAMRVLGLLDVPHFAPWTAAAALDIPLPEAENLIDRLVDAQLLEVAHPAPPVRYRFHDLIRVLARERATEQDPAAERQAILARTFSGWLTLAEHAAGRLPSTCLGAVPGPVPRWTAAPPVGEPLEWFEEERSCLVAIVDQACAQGLGETAWELTQTLTDFFDLRGLYDEWRHAHEHALAIARRTGDRLGQAVLLRGLAQLGTYTQPPWDYLRRAMVARTLFAELGHAVGESDALLLCAHAHRVTGRADEALDCLEAALRLAQRTGHRAGEAFAHGGIGEVHREQGRLTEAMGRFERCLTLWRNLGRERHVALALHNLGLVHRALGQNEASERRLREALTLLRGLGDRLSEADAQHSLAILELEHGHADKAAALLERALRLWRDLGVPYREAGTLRLLGDAYAARGDVKAAEESWQRALRLLRDLGPDHP